MKNKRTMRAWCNLSLAAAVLALPCAAQDSQDTAEGAAAESPVVITATRLEQRSFDLPVAIDSIDKEQIQEVAKPA